MCVHIQHAADVVDVGLGLFSGRLGILGHLMQIKDQLILFPLTLGSLLHIEVVSRLGQDGIVCQELRATHGLRTREVHERPEDVASDLGDSEFDRDRLIIFEELLDDLHLVRVDALACLVTTEHRNDAHDHQLFLHVLVVCVAIADGLEQIEPLLNDVLVAGPLDVLQGDL